MSAITYYTLAAITIAATMRAVLPFPGEKKASVVATQQPGRWHAFH